MRQVNSVMILEPQLTAFQVAILMGLATKEVEKLRALAKDDPDNIASTVASMVEYDNILTGLKAEHDLYEDYRRPRLRGKPMPT